MLRDEKGDHGAIVIDVTGVAFDESMDIDVHAEMQPLWEAESDGAESGLVRGVRRDGIPP